MANKNSNLGAAKVAKNDEFYTQYEDIEREMNAYLEYDENVFRGKTVLLPCDDPEWSNFTRYFAQNFERFGLRKLISTSYAAESKKFKDWEPTLFETEAPNFDLDKTKTHGKIFVLDSDTNGSGRIDIEDLKWDYLEGDGDFRSDEVKRLRDEADIIVTNPPFSLFREFLAWIKDGNKKFCIIGNQNAIHFKEVFPLIESNQIWLGNGFKSGATHFFSPYEDKAVAGEHIKGMIRVSGVIWITNIDHGRRHQPLQLMTMADNIKYSKHDEIRNKGYVSYDNYDAIDIPYSDAIPADYDGLMGVPDTFLSKFCPEQFEIVGLGAGELAKQIGVSKNYRGRTDIQYTKDGKPGCPYSRIIIRKKKQQPR